MASGIAYNAELVLVFSALLNALVIYPVLSKLQEDERSSMASFKLNSEETLKDFKIFFLVIVVFMVSIFIVFLGDLTGNATLNFVGDFLSMISSFLPLVIFIRWKRRFL